MVGRGGGGGEGDGDGEGAGVWGKIEWGKSYPRKEISEDDRTPNAHMQNISNV
jgi:hypothetical protein